MEIDSNVLIRVQYDRYSIVYMLFGEYVLRAWVASSLGYLVAPSAVAFHSAELKSHPSTKSQLRKHPSPNELIPMILLSLDTSVIIRLSVKLRNVVQL
jgi:hypothetical protein